MQSDTRCSSNGSASPNLASLDCSGLRRSSRLTPSKKNFFLTPSSTTKFTPTAEKTPPLKPLHRKIAEEQGELPLRRSTRGTAAPHSGKSEKSLTATESRNKTGKRRRSEEDSPMEVKECVDNGKHESNPERRKRLNAQSYRALFKTSDPCNGRRYGDGSPSGSPSRGDCLGEIEDAKNVNGDFIGDLGKDNTVKGDFIGDLGKDNTVNGDFIEDLGKDNTESTTERPRLSDPSPMNFCCNGNSDKEDVEPRFIEYWVPAEVLNVQLEQYCSSLLSDSVVLCSKSDPLGSLPRTLLCARKCCDHPYIVNPKLQHALIQGHLEELVDIGIRASGKLHLLDAILSEVKNQALRVLVLFQAVGSTGRDSMGDILDDFVRERYGTDSYERIDACEIESRKKKHLNKFNNSHNTRFIFLLDTRACSPIIKLQSVDCVIIFNSDWNPLADLKCLKKIKIDTKKEKINVFRLYTSCTIDEKVLILSKNGLVLDSNMQTVNWNTGQTLLMWGASYLFKRLGDFHDSDAFSRNDSMLPADFIFEKVFLEFSSLLQQHGGTIEYKFISKATMKGGVYSRDISLAGEQIFDLGDDELPSLFWEKLLKGRCPRWRYLPVLSSQRSRKRIQHSEETSTVDVQIAESSKKPKVVGSADTGSCGPKACAEAGKQPSSGASGRAAELSPQSASDSSAVSAGKQRLLEEQKSLHQDLKPVMTKLFEILALQEEVKEMAERFLKYVINNHRVTKEPESILQAFEISVCWVAASLLGQKIDHKDSLILARKHLEFSCDDDEADYILSKMRSVSGMFIHRSEDLRGLCSPREPNTGTKSLTREAASRDSLQSDLFNQQKITDKLKETLGTCSNTQGQTLPVAVSKVGSNNKIPVKCAEQLERLIQQQSKEVHELRKSWEEKKVELEKNHLLDTLVIQSIHPILAVRNEKLKSLGNEYKKRCQELDWKMVSSLRDLESRHRLQKRMKGVNRADSLFPSAEAEVTREIPQVAEDNKIQGVSDDPGNLQVDHIPVDDPSTTPTAESSLPGIMEGDSSMQVVESCQVPPVPVNKEALVSDNDDNSNYLPEAQRSNEVIPANEATLDNVERSNEVIPANEATLDNVEMVNPATDFHEMNTRPSCGPSLEVQRHDEARPILQQSTGKHITEELANLHVNDNTLSNQKTLPGRCNGATIDGDEPGSGQLLTPSSMAHSHANPSEANLLVADQSHANASNDATVDHQQAIAETMSGTQDCVIQSGDLQGTGEEPGVSHNEAVQAVPSSLAPDECSHPSPPSSSVPQPQLVQDNPLELGVSCTGAVQHAVPTLVVSDERSQPSLPLSSEPPHQPTQDNPLEPLTQHMSNPSRTPTIADLPPPGLQHPTARRSLPSATEVRGHIPPVGLPLPSQRAAPDDPLQNVLDKLQDQMFQSKMKYTETKSRLDAERDKEIAEMVSQIQKKYELNAKEADASFLQQNEEFAGMLAIVQNNKRLAEEFRCKCIDFRATQAAPPPVIHQQQQQQQRRYPTPTYTSRRIPQPSQFGPAHTSRPPMTTRAADHLQASPIPFADIHSRQHIRPPAVIIPHVTSSDHLQASPVPFADIHSRQHIRPPAIISPHVTSSGQQHRSAPATFIPQFGSAPPAPAPSSMSVQPSNSALSSMSVPSSGRPSVALPPLPEIARHFDSWNLSGFDTSESEQQLPVSGPARRSNDAHTEEQQPNESVPASQPVPDIVCLSDDDII